ncbi:hypothetical protein ACFPLB_02630 [Aquamicrobium segne]|uniref:Uncharacterized protein n=1 Tax=Aquamicrobium segne TaxID=469547 RepID=A0ABW0GUF1_9HYPH
MRPHLKISSAEWAANSDGMLITRKGAGTAISAVRSQALGPFKAARAPIRRNMVSFPDRWGW